MTTMMMRWSSLFLPIALVLLAGAAADGECGAARPDHLALKLAAPSAATSPAAPSATSAAVRTQPASQQVDRILFHHHPQGVLFAQQVAGWCPFFFAEYTLPGLRE